MALVLACVASDSQGAFSGDDGDDDVAVCFDLAAVLPAARVEPLVALAPAGVVFLDERAPSGRAPELEIFRPPEAHA